MSAPRPMGDHERILRDWRAAAAEFDAAAFDDDPGAHAMQRYNLAALGLREAGDRLVMALSEHGCHR